MVREVSGQFPLLTKTDHRLFVNDAHDAACPRSVDCGEGGDDWRGW
jgi:hypothetical protein